MSLPSFSTVGPQTSLHRLDPRMKLSGTVAWLLVITGSESLNRLAFFAFFTLILLAAARIRPRILFRTLVLVIPLLFIMGGLFYLSYFLSGDASSQGGLLSHSLGRLFVLIAAKSTLAILLLRLLIATTPIHDLLWAMRRFGFPRIITTLSLLVAAYLHLLTEETERIIRARSSRSSKGDRHPLRSLAHVAATVFLLSMTRADRLYKAMLARGFRGEYPDTRTARMGSAEGIAAFSLSAIIVIGFLWIPS